MQLASNISFPYGNPNICYLYVANNFDVKQINKDITPQEAFENAMYECGDIYAIWWDHDAYIIDNIMDFAIYFGCVIPDELPLTIIGAEHRNNKFDSSTTAYVQIYVRTDKESIENAPCFIQKFNKLLEDTYGWTYAKQYSFSCLRLTHNITQINISVINTPDSRNRPNFKECKIGYPIRYGEIPADAEW